MLRRMEIKKKEDDRGTAIETAKVQVVGIFLSIS